MTKAGTPGRVQGPAKANFRRCRGPFRRSLGTKRSPGALGPALRVGRRRQQQRRRRR
jgi:hypothetical protein